MSKDSHQNIPKLKLKDLAKNYGEAGKRVSIIHNLNAEFNECEIIALLGKSGSGKTTLLNLISGNLTKYVGNLPFSTTEDELRAAFGQYGDVSDVNILTDRETGRPRGFGFVEMKDDNAGREAISALDGSDLGGRQLKVNEARPRNEGGGGRRY